MADKNPYLNVSDLTGGINDADSPFSIEPNQVTEAKNLDFRAGRIGTKRNGMEAVPLTGSLFERAVPRLATTNKGGYTGTNTGSITVSTYANVTDSTTNTNHFLLVLISSSSNIPTTVTLGGVALTMSSSQISGGIGTYLSVWYLRTPSLAGGTLTVTLVAGAWDVSIIAERWIEVDTAASPGAFVSGNTNGALSFTTTIASNPKMVVVGGVSARSTSTFVNFMPGPLAGSQLVETHGTTSQLVTIAVLGRPGSTSITWGDATGGDTAETVTTILGRNDVTGSTLGLAGAIVVALIRHSPTNDPTQDELWALDSWGRLDIYRNGAWVGTVPMMNEQVGLFVTSLATPASYHSNGVSLHGKLFLALLGGTTLVDRLLVWDGTVLRWAGIDASAAPTGANTAPAGTFSGTRYYRVRWAELVGGVAVRRSEPSPVLTFAPSGTKTGIVVTEPTVLTSLQGFEGQTHWELEASTDNTLFYRIATTVLATTTVTDTAPFAATATYTAFPLSENIGEYVVPGTPRHVAVDQDRLMLAGSPFNALNDSRVSWTPVRADTGVGNDERVPITARFFQDLDGLSGGCLTHLIPGMMGGMYAFKLQRIYKLTRTGSATRAYDVQFETASRGCFLRAGRLSSGINGAPVIYFVDPNVGLCGFSDQGVEDLMQTRRTLAARINRLPSVLNARLAVFSKHWIVWVWVALDGAVVPNYGLAYNIRTRGWTDVTGGFANVVAAVPCFTTWAGEVPYVAVSTPRTSYICEADTTATDDGLPFRAWITSKPMQLGQLYRKFGIQAAVLHAKAAASTIGLALIRNLGLERKDVSTSIAPVGAETYVVEPMDDARMSECQFVQFELGDPVTYAGAQLQQTWTLDELAAKLRSEDESTS